MRQEFPLEDDPGRPLRAFSWWERMRLIYNLIMLLEGISLIILAGEKPNSIFITAVAIYALLANVFYSLGFMLEMANIYYFGGKIRMEILRWPIFVLGTLFSMLVTLVIANGIGVV